MQFPRISGSLTMIFCNATLTPSTRIESAFMKLLDPDYCRRQAREVGAQVEELRNHCVKRDLARITRSYHLLAELAESRQKSVAKQTTQNRSPVVLKSPITEF
jgi:hypothetical protein